MAQVARLYTKTSGKYDATEQHVRSHFFAQLRGFRLIGGGEEEGDNKVVMLLICSQT